MRLFVAIDVPQDIQAYFKGIQKQLPPCSLTSSLHLTLKFLGDVSEIEINNVILSLSKIKFSRLNLSTGGLGAFPDKNHIRVLWVGIEDNPSLMQLQADIENNLGSFKKDFSFHPHITLARVNRTMLFPDISPERRSFAADRFVLYQSTLHPGAPVYQKTKEFSENL